MLGISALGSSRFCQSPAPSYLHRLLLIAQMSQPQIPKQLHITPLPPPFHRNRYPPYLLLPYINVKEAVHHVLSEEWYDREECIARRLRSQTNLIRKQKSTAVVSRMTTGDKKGKKSPGFYGTIEGQLKLLGLGAFQGRAHSGIDVSVLGMSRAIARSRKPP